jgi:hypothetical protein
MSGVVFAYIQLLAWASLALNFCESGAELWFLFLKFGNKSDKFCC